MKTTRIICDYCENEIKEDVIIYSFGIAESHEFLNYANEYDEELAQMHFCKDCTDRFISAIKTKSFKFSRKYTTDEIAEIYKEQGTIKKTALAVGKSTAFVQRIIKEYEAKTGEKLLFHGRNQTRSYPKHNKRHIEPLDVQEVVDYFCECRNMQKTRAHFKTDYKRVADLISQYEIDHNVDLVQRRSSQVNKRKVLYMLKNGYSVSEIVRRTGYEARNVHKIANDERKEKLRKDIEEMRSQEKFFDEEWIGYTE